ncbi:hypothetical protein N7462_006567 [Penicillium macrosclerotiorum]|uniref:uncharacterized protein n=1 Tax=Penicillium macrosclerotiorum TaxID=303699 RepID=UPI00254675B7|nr:uncharacterized protein N7462_006567 [Penicillium macrosclerotiorum]KAJ5683402.1 hypothetical protein N7462_006567 [Penicillium macrosclerotiorum]
MKENIWHIHVRHGCRVHVLAPKDGDGLNRKVLLSGSERAVEVAEDNIKQSQSLQTNGDPLIEIQRPTVSVLSSRDALNRKKLPIPVIRGVWTFPKPKKEHLTLDEVIKAGPSFGTVKEFAEHIEDLVNTHRLKSIERAQDKVDVAPEEQIAKRIVQLFGGDTNQKVISTAALNSALEFLFKHEFLKPARDIFNRGVQFATADTYNILLRSAARRQDKRMFQLFLQNMSQQQIQPNADTWLALLEAMLTSKTKSYIIKDMAKKGYMKDINTVRGALQLTISDSFLVHLDGGRNVHSFFDLMMKTNGADWFSPSLLGQLFNVVSRTKNFNAMDELLDICIQNQLELNGSCLTQVLHMVEDDIHSALEYTHKFLESRQFKMDSRAFEKLFLIAFQGHNYNICRVLWHYACMEQAVTFRMRSTVLNSFVRNTSVKNGSEDISNIWQLSAGKVIVRNNLRNACQPKDFPINELSSEFWEHPFLYLLSGFKPKGPERALQLRLAKAFVDHDIQLGSNDYQPKYSLAIMLEAAVIMDREWENKPRPLTWMLQNAIEIPIRTRD